MPETKVGFQGYKIVVGVTGGIAAYKVVDLVRELCKNGAEVHVIMTRTAKEFVGPATFEAISGNSVHLNVLDSVPGWSFPHLELAQKADAVIIAPATAHFLARAACGMADDLLSTVLLACQSSVFICPAMNAKMYTHPVVQENLNRIKDIGYTVVEPDYGYMACGDYGPGRLAEIGRIISELKEQLTLKQDLCDYSILVTAGATREFIDPIRFISNRSTGKMGFAIARAAIKRGARVTLISGPLHPEPPPGVELVVVNSAMDMYTEVVRHYPSVDVVIKAAAVGDYSPVEVAEHKIKKDNEHLILELIKNPDILQELGRTKRNNQLLVGFAAETENLVDNAVKKLRKKNLDLMIANDVTIPGAGFGTDTNIVKFIYSDGSTKPLDLMRKEDLSNIILNEIIDIKAKKTV